MYWLMKIDSNLLFILSGIFSKTYHQKNINFEKSHIIIPTHKSYIEAVTIYTTIQKVFKTLGKKELEKTPLYGLIFKAVCISVDRSSLAARAMSFRKMKQELEQKLSIVIFPEGTFSDEPKDVLLPFQDGCFSLAIMQKCDLLPILFLDSAERMHPKKIYQMTPGYNRAVYLPAISVLERSKKDTVALKMFVQNYMQACLDFIQENDIENVWDFALKYQKNNTPLYT